MTVGDSNEAHTIGLFKQMTEKGDRYMATYAVARLWDVIMGPQIVQYLEGIDATLAPFQGRFLIHGGDIGAIEKLEGDWAGDLIIIEFPDRHRAQAWYHSETYQKLLPLRLSNAKGDVILIDTVPDGHKSTDLLK
jgi:uncharacterized protein (DUF1330 family)